MKSPESDDPARDLEGLVRGGRSRPSAEASGARSPIGPAWLERRLEAARNGNRRWRAFVHLDPDRARAEATRSPGGPLAGRVLGHKDIFLTEGQPTRAGSALLEDFVPDRDADVVVRLRQAGAISLGKLATHEFATGVTGLVMCGEPPINPRAPDRVPGGSSCGSAVAVAAGLVDLASGSDTGGSIRIPSACCGTVGLKPTFGAVSTRGMIPFSPTLDHAGPIGGAVELVRTAAEVLLGRALAPPDRTPRLARVDALLESCEPRVADVVARAGLALEAAGCQVEPITLPELWGESAGIATAIFLTEGGRFHRFGLARHRSRYRPPTAAFLERASEVSSRTYRRALRARERLMEAMEALLADFDALLLPALPCLPPRLTQEEVELPGGPVDVRAALTEFTRPVNLTGQPAIVLPCGRANGLPVAAQLIGGRGREAEVLASARVLESGVGGPWSPESAG